MDISSGTKLGRYDIRSKIGEGGMGEVYLAQDTSELGRSVALKIVSAEVAKDKDRLQRFTQEARTVSNLNHPNILTIYEFGQRESVSFIATEFVDGVTLREHLSKRRLKLIDVLDIAIQIVGALNAAHEAGVTHRDLKPENVMVRKDHIVKVLDFGLAKLAQPPAAATGSTGSEDATRLQVNTTPGLIMGTVSYMSPEQSAGGAVDQRTDIWSAGVVLYEMIAGRVPFQGKDVHRQIIAIQEQDPPPLSQQVEGVPERLEEIVVKCLAKEKDERYQTAKDLLIDLRNLRRKLDVDAEIERTYAPDLRSTASGAGSAQAIVSNAQPSGAQTAPGNAQPTSSAEYIVHQIKQHRRGALIIAFLIIVAAASIATYLLLAKRNIGPATSTSSETIDSIAVLPLTNESHDPNVDWLADGLTESIIYKLSQLPNLKVMARSTVFRYKGKEIDPAQAARELNVRAVMMGHVLQHGDDLTVSAELVDTRDNRLLWGDRYERKMADLNSVQQEIAREVSEKLRQKLTGAEQKLLAKGNTESTEAYQLYLKGRFYWNRRTAENLKKAIEQFKGAAEKDPNYALAYVGLADCYSLLEEYAGTPSSETLPQARSYAERALAIDDSLAEAHASMGQINEGLWLWPEAEKEFKRAIELNPNYPTAHHWYSIYLKAMGRWDEAWREIKRAQELDPLSNVINVNVLRYYLHQNDLNSASELSRKMLELDPNFSLTYEYLGMINLKQGRNSEAIAPLEKAAELGGRASQTLSHLGYAYAVAGKRTEAIAVIKELEGRYARREAIGQYLAAVYAGLGEKDEAFAWLEKDFQARSGRLLATTFDEPFEPLRSDPRYRDLLRRMNLPQ